MNRFYATGKLWDEISVAAMKPLLVPEIPRQVTCRFAHCWSWRSWHAHCEPAEGQLGPSWICSKPISHGPWSVDDEQTWM